MLPSYNQLSLSSCFQTKFIDHILAKVFEINVFLIIKTQHYQLSREFNLLEGDLLLYFLYDPHLNT